MLAHAQTARTAADFHAVSVDGKTVDLASLKGKVVMLAFWSTRCPICQSELPKLNQLASDLAGQNVVLLAPTAESEDVVRSFLRRNRFDFEILPDSFGLMLKYAERDRDGRLNFGFPTYFLIDRSGRLAFRSSGWDQTGPVAAQIQKLLSAK